MQQYTIRYLAASNVDERRYFSLFKLSTKLYGFEPYSTANRMQQLRTTRLVIKICCIMASIRKTCSGLLEQENSKYLYVPNTLQGSFWWIWIGPRRTTNATRAHIKMWKISISNSMGDSEAFRRGSRGFQGASKRIWEVYQGFSGYFRRVPKGFLFD